MRLADAQRLAEQGQGRGKVAAIFFERGQIVRGHGPAHRIGRPQARIKLQRRAIVRLGGSVFAAILLHAGQVVVCARDRDAFGAEDLYLQRQRFGKIALGRGQIAEFLLGLGQIVERVERAWIIVAVDGALARQRLRVQIARLGVVAAMKREKTEIVQCRGDFTAVGHAGGGKNRQRRVVIAFGGGKIAGTLLGHSQCVMAVAQIRIVARQARRAQRHRLAAGGQCLRKVGCTGPGATILVQRPRQAQRIAPRRAQQGDRATEQIGTALRLADADVDFAERGQQARLYLGLCDRRGIEPGPGLIEQFVRADVIAARALRIGVLKQADQEIGDFVCGVRLGSRLRLRAQRPCAFDRQPRCRNHDRGERQRRNADTQTMPAHELGDAIADAIRTRGQHAPVEIAFDVVGQGRCRRITTRRILIQCTPHDMLQIAVDTRCVGAQPILFRPPHDAPGPRQAPALRVAAGFVHFSTKQFVQDQAERVHVAGGSYGHATQLFGTGVFGRECTQLGHAFAARIRRIQARDAEIQQRRRAVAAHHHVGRLQIAVHDQVLVRKMHGGTQLLEQAQALRQRRPVRVQPLRQQHAADVLHDQVRLALVGGAAVEQARDVRMHEAGQQLAFAAQAFQSGGRGEAADQLDRDAAFVFGIGALGEEHAAHAAATQFAQDAVVADAPPEPRRSVVEMFRRALRDARGQRIVRLRIGCKQAFEFGAQFRVRRAFVIQESRARLGRQRDRGVEQFLQARETAHGVLMQPTHASATRDRSAGRDRPSARIPRAHARSRRGSGRRNRSAR